MAMTLALFLPWLIMQKDVSLPADMAWLTIAAQHILSGDRMTDAFFDNNPPLCYLIYIPVALLISAGLPMELATYIFSVLFVECFSFQRIV